MTPLAKELVDHFVLPPRLREQELFDPDNRLRLVPEAHCFEVSAVRETADSLAASIIEHSAVQRRLAFLPAPITIIEEWDPTCYGGHGGDRTGLLLIQTPDGLEAEVYCLGPQSMGLSITSVGRIALEEQAEVTGIAKGEGRTPANEEQLRKKLSHPERLLYAHRKAGIYARLALINTPRVIGRRQHMPQPGLQKQIARAKGMVGKFPLQAWTEIILEVTPPHYAGDDGAHEVRLSGGKALHFCRSHLRVQNGMVVLVRAHWRGDPALGLKQTRYAVVPPRRQGRG